MKIGGKGNGSKKLKVKLIISIVLLILSKIVPLIVDYIY